MVLTVLVLVLLLASPLLASLGCAGSTGATKADTRATGLAPDRAIGAYAQDVESDGPLGHWRLPGGSPGALDIDEDTATVLERGVPLSRADVGVGGAEFSAELWVKGARGTALSYRGPDGRSAIAVSMNPTLVVELLGERSETSIVLDDDWQLIALSWRSVDGHLIVSVDGVTRWQGSVAVGQMLPFDGQLAVGGEFGGAVDELAVYDRALHPSSWLARYLVGKGRIPPVRPEGELLVQGRTQLGHADIIKMVSWSPSGAYFATSSLDFTVKIWDASTGVLLRGMQQAFSAVWSPDGRRLATVHAESAKIWDARSGALLHEFAAPKIRTQAGSLAWSPDGARLGLIVDQTVQVWSAFEGQLVQEIELVGEAATHQTWTPERLAWSPDGAHLAVAVMGSWIQLFEGQSGRLLRTLRTRGWNPRDVDGLAWSPDGRRVAVTQEHGALVYRVDGPDAGPENAPESALRVAPGRSEAGDEPSSASWEKVRPFSVTSLVFGVTWSPDATRIACATNTGNSADTGGIAVWDAADGVLVGKYQQNHNEVTALAYSPDGTALLVGREDGGVQLLDAETFAPRFKRGALDQVVDLAWSGDGTGLAIGSTDGGVRVWRMPAGVLSRALDAHDNRISDVAWTKDGRGLLSKDNSGTAALSSVDDGSRLSVAEGHILVDVSESPDGGSLLTREGLERYRIGEPDDWDHVNLRRRDGAVIGRIESLGRQSGLNSAWSPDGRRLATDSGDGRVRVWKVADASLDHQLRVSAAPPGSRRGLFSLAWSPDGERLATGNPDGGIRVWRIEDGSLAKELSGLASRVTSLAWSPDGRRLAAGSRDRVTKIWDVDGGPRPLELVGHPRGNFEESGVRVEWSGDGERLVTTDTAPIIWNSRSGEKVAELQPSWKTPWVWDDARTRLACASSSTIEVSRVSDGQRLHRLELEDGIATSIGWRPGDERLAVGSDTGVVMLWDLTTDRTVALHASPSNGWIASTEDGFFAASADANIALVRGLESYDLAQLAPARNRPDKVLAELGGPAEAIEFYQGLWRRRAQRLGVDAEVLSFASAPTARILGHSEDLAKHIAELVVTFRDSAGLRGYQCYVNGVPIAADLHSLEGTHARRTITVKLTAGRNLIDVTAFNAAGLESLRASATVEHDGTGLPKPRLFYLGLGVSDYADDAIDLKFAHQDAIDLGETFARAEGRFASVHTRVFTDQQVAGDILDEVGEFLADADEQDTVVMFIAGHGVRARTTDRTFYYIDYDTRLDDLAATAIPFDAIEQRLYEARARQKLLLIDTCQSGDDIDIGGWLSKTNATQGVQARSIRALVFEDSSLETPSTQPQDLESWIEILRDRNRMITQDLGRRSGTITLSASLGREASLEHRAWANGAFTEEVLRALQSERADADHDGVVDTSELIHYVSGAVPGLTCGRQHPNVERDNPAALFGFPVVTSSSAEPTPVECGEP